MILPINEKREFFNGVLKNNIKYSIIQDKNISQASVCVCIKAGSINNPKEYQGLAHFLEHMLFLGSKKYPKENYFDDTLKCHGGISNAYTALFETVYYFSVNNNYLEKILDIFSRFFIDPLFDKDSVSREINAINSEHMKNYHNDMWRLNHFLTNLSDKDSIINKFTTGNLDSLKKKNVREKMIEFYNSYYCSNNITVALITPDNITDVNKLFSNIFNKIPNKKSIKNNITKTNKFFNNSKTEYQIIPVLDNINIYYVWEINFPFNFLNNKVFDIIDFAIEDDGKNNLEQILFKKNLINSLGSFVLEEGMFVLNININKNKNIKNTIQKINDHVSYYFNNLHKINWNKVYDYVDKKSKILFNNTKISNEIDLIDTIAMNMHYFSKKHYLSGSKLVIEKDIELLKDEINKLKFDKCFIVYSLQDKLENNKLLVEPIYESKYYLLKNKLAKKEIIFDFKINTDNKYININPIIIKNLEKNKIPILKKNRIWYGSISNTNESFVLGNILLNSNTFFNNIKNYLITLLSINYINYKLSKNFYQEGDLGYITYINENNITSNIHIIVGGFNDKYDLFFQDFLKYFNLLTNEVKMDKSIIVNNINKVIEKLKNVKFKSPWDYSSIVITNSTNKNSYNTDDKIKFLENTSVDELFKLVKKRVNNIVTFNKLGVTVLFYGNYKYKNLPNLDIFKNNFEISIKNPIKTSVIKNIKFKKPNKDDTNNLYSTYFNSGIFNPFNNTILIMISILMEQPCYDYLRTKKQLGYLVKSGILKNNPYYYLEIKVQSEKSVEEIKKNINDFINIFKDILDNLNLADIKQTTKELLEEKINGISHYNSKFLNEINYRTFTFKREDILLNQLNKISKNDIIKYFNKLLKTRTNLILD